MRGKRAKKYRKLMHQYELAFGFREPFQVLLDSRILQDAAQQKIDVVSRLQGVLGGAVKPMVTQCDMRHLYDATPKDNALIAQAKEFERRRCGHHELDKPLSSLQCLFECVDPKDNQTNRHRYVVATQDRDVRARMRAIPGVPLIYINKSVMILEPLATSTEDLRDRDERAKFKAGLKGRRGANAGEKRKRDEENAQAEDGSALELQSTGDERPQKKKRKGPKGPNPLSVKKSTKQKPTTKSIDAPSRQENSIVLKDYPVQPGEASVLDGDQASRRKRKRKHKSKGDGGVQPHAEDETAVP